MKRQRVVTTFFFGLSLVWASACASSEEDMDSSAAEDTENAATDSDDSGEGETGSDESGDAGAEEGGGTEGGTEADTDGDDSGEEGDDETGDEAGDDSGGDAGTADSCEGLEDPGLTTAPVEGAAVNHLQGVGPEGETISFCDYAGKVTIIDFAFTTCGPCQGFAEYIGSGTADVGSAFFGSAENDQLVMDKLAAGEIGMLTLLAAGEQDVPTAQDAKNWHDAYPIVNAEVMSVVTPETMGGPLEWLYQNWGVSGYPTLAGVSSDFKWAGWSLGENPGVSTTMPTFIQNHIAD